MKPTFWTDMSSTSWLRIALLVLAISLMVRALEAQVQLANTKIAFSLLEDNPNPHEADFNWEIYMMNADGTNLVRLTHHPASDLYPCWSPDGTKIAFTYRFPLCKVRSEIVQPTHYSAVGMTASFD